MSLCCEPTENPAVQPTQSNTGMQHVVEKCSSQEPLTAARQFDSEETNSRPLEAAGCRIMSRGIIIQLDPSETYDMV